jgi:hypothetical protein
VQHAIGHEGIAELVDREDLLLALPSPGVVHPQLVGLLFDEGQLERAPFLGAELRPGGRALVG